MLFYTREYIMDFPIIIPGDCYFSQEEGVFFMVSIWIVFMNVPRAADDSERIYS